MIISAAFEPSLINACVVYKSKPFPLKSDEMHLCKRQMQRERKLNSSLVVIKVREATQNKAT